MAQLIMQTVLAPPLGLEILPKGDSPKEIVPIGIAIPRTQNPHTHFEFFPILRSVLQRLSFRSTFVSLLFIEAVEGGRTVLKGRSAHLTASDSILRLPSYSGLKLHS